MSMNSTPRAVNLALLMVACSACSTIKSWFPDKERDYQFTTEIAEIKIPSDLQASALTMPAVGTATVAAPQPALVNTDDAAVMVESTDRRKVKPAKQAQQATADKVDNPPANAEKAPSSQAQPSTPSTSSLQIDQPRSQAMHIVSKAMSRQRLEVIERNMENGYFVVKYDIKAEKVEDQTWLDEVNFLFGDEPNEEVECRVQLQQINPQLTEVTVHDLQGKAQSPVVANNLLKLITDAINQEVGTPAAVDTAVPADAGKAAK